MDDGIVRTSSNDERVPTVDERVPRWVRVAMLVVIAVPQVVTGAWAVLAPHHWFDHFPGLGPLLVAAEPPFNAHLATDAGAGFLATGVAVAAAALLARRQLVLLALGTFLVAVAPHVVYHAAHFAPGLSDGENVVNVGMLAFSAVTAVALLWASWRPAASGRTAAGARQARVEGST